MESTTRRIEAGGFCKRDAVRRNVIYRRHRSYRDARKAFQEKGPIRPEVLGATRMSRDLQGLWGAQFWRRYLVRITTKVDVCKLKYQANLTSEIILFNQSQSDRLCLHASKLTIF